MINEEPPHIDNIADHYTTDEDLTTFIQNLEQNAIQAATDRVPGTHEYRAVMSDYYDLSDNDQHTHLSDAGYDDDIGNRVDIIHDRVKKSDLKIEETYNKVIGISDAIERLHDGTAAVHSDFERRLLSIENTQSDVVNSIAEIAKIVRVIRNNMIIGHSID